jgi:hypothetical protein
MNWNTIQHAPQLQCQRDAPLWIWSTKPASDEKFSVQPSHSQIARSFPARVASSSVGRSTVTACALNGAAATCGNPPSVVESDLTDAERDREPDVGVSTPIIALAVDCAL